VSPTFRRNVLPQTSKSKIKPSNKETVADEPDVISNSRTIVADPEVTMTLELAERNATKDAGKAPLNRESPRQFLNVEPFY
jgi:hypothetical protein